MRLLAPNRISYTDSPPVLPVGKSKERRPVQLPIKIENVSHFSYGAYENGDVDIWAAGSAGWFRLHPSSKYVSIFEEMKRAVKVFYFVADTYLDQPKLPVTGLFEKYARAHKTGGAEMAKRYIVQHKEFLASRMEKGAEGLKWGQTPIYQYFLKAHPEVFDSHKKSALEMLRRSKSRSQPVHTPSLEDEPRKFTRHSRRGEANSEDEKMVGNGNLYRNGHASYQLGKEEVKTKVNTLWSFMQNVAGHERILTLANVARAAYQYFTFDDEIQASDYIVFFGPEIVSKIQRKHIGKQRWTESPFYRELLDAELSRSMRAKIAQLNVQRRTDAVYVPQSHQDDEDMSSESEVRHTQQSRHLKGGLRPKGSGKGTGKKGKSYTGPANRAAMDIDETSEASTPRKRKNAFKEGNLPKRTRSLALSSDATTPQSQEQESEDYQAEDSEDELQRDHTLTSLPSHASHETPILSLFSTPSHDQAANAPGDQYNCPHSDCNHIVYAASTELGQELISEHLAEHDEKMRLVVNEKNLTNLPVGNLIRRIREMAAFGEGDGFGMEGLGSLAGNQMVQRAI